MLIKEPLLLTGTIAPTLFLKDYNSFSLNPDKRVKEYLKGIIYYILYSNFKYITFVENSDYGFDKYEKKLKDLAKDFDKEFEFLQFKGDNDKVLETSYSYGECELMDYAIDHSKLIKNAKSFYKITGRYIYKDINKIIDTSSDNDNLLFRFMYPYAYFCINTGLFKINKNTYIKKLYNKKAKITKNRSVEYLFYEELRDSKINFGKLKMIPLKEDQEINMFHKILFYFGFWNLGNILGYILDRILYKTIIKKWK